ncbi:MAG: 2OG-Fe(II) oxygenase [Actinobacteria bacterium]|nr:2OG-Fe(II) oxygenase [Actinomycetota bacterium]
MREAATDEVFGDWIGDVGAVAQQFRAGQPFPLVIIEGFVHDDLAKQLVDEFPSLDAMPRSHDYVFADKRELSDLQRFGPAGTKLEQALLSERFAAALSEIVGTTIFVDPDFYGGGFHQSGDGGYLDMHVDFNIHPEHKTWFRMLNVLLYLNPEWEDDFGGHLLVKPSPDATPRAIAPNFNRGVIMTTNESTYHGFRPMKLPSGVTRRSIAAYGYRLVAEGESEVRTTGWAPEDASLGKRLLAKGYNRVVTLKNRYLGSGTTKNRR